MFVLVPFVPNVLDVFAPLNFSRTRQIPIPGEYFVDQQKYFYAILLQSDFTVIIVVITLLGTESLYVTHVQHACGLFQVARWRNNRKRFKFKFAKCESYLEHLIWPINVKRIIPRYFCSYRINRAFDENLLQSYTPDKRTIIICQRIVEAVHIHKRALESVYNRHFSRQYTEEIFGRRIILTVVCCSREIIFVSLGSKVTIKTTD